MTRSRSTFFAAIALAAACDPVQSNAIDALGGEAPGVPHGPTHRPGQPCLLCHEGGLGHPPAFSVAGTVFDHPSDPRGVNGATVSLTDANGAGFNAITNTVGNFYITPAQWTPAFPLTVIVTGAGGQKVTMHTDIGRDGACGACHVDPPGPSSPGRVYLALDDGGAPP